MSAPISSRQSERLDRARGLLDRAHRTAEDRGRAGPRPEVVPAAAILPVAPVLAALLPHGGLRRGSTVLVRSSTSLLFAVLAEASTQGAWCALVGLPEVGVVAAAEAGLVLSRVALVPEPGPDLVAVTSALLDGVEMVVIAGTRRLRAGDRQRLAARARQRNAVLVPFGHSWPGADVELELVNHPGQWQRLGADGHGRLRARRTQVQVASRGAAHRGRKATVLLPGPTGALASTERSRLSAAPAPHATPPPAAARKVG
jgi:hypothetical protein